MTATTAPSYRSELRPATETFVQLLRAEWTKFRTVRGWVIGMIVAVLVTVGIGLLNHSSCGGVVTPGGASAVGAGCAAPVGPGGEAVTDQFYFVAQPLTGDGRITVRMTALTSASLQPWAKGGILVQASTRPGSAYAAMMLTGGHGARMQYNYTGDIAGPSGAVSPAAPRWLRLTRSGDTLTGYQSADGTRWTTVGTVRLAGLPATVRAGMFAASPASSHATSQSVTGSSSAGGIGVATAVFDHVSLRSQRPGGAWTGDNVGAIAGGAPPGVGLRRSGPAFAVTGTGDIAPEVPGASGGGDETPIEQTLLGAFGGLIAVIVVAVMFMTAEYRRGLIRVTLAASPRRGRVLAAKAAVIGAVTFAAGLIGSVAALAVGVRLLRANGNYILPLGPLTEVRVVAGTAAVLAVAAVLALALGALLRSSAAAVTIAIVAIVLPYLMVNALPTLPAGASDWLLRLTPAAGFAIQQSLPQYPQVAASYTPVNGYYPLAPWAGFAVLCGYAVVALGLAVISIRRRDA
jgi:ABC-type transport system involved in multi-copper enzyme maturation permease subunit